MLQWDDNIVAIVFGAPIKSNERCRALYIQLIFPQYTVPIMLCHENEAQFRQCVEKNWSPIGPANDQNKNYAEGYLFAYSMQPFHVIKFFLSGSCMTVSSMDTTVILQYYQQLYAYVPIAQKATLTLATNAVRLSNQTYGSIFHFKIPRPTPPRFIYYSVAYVFEAKFPYSIVKVATKPLDLPEAHKDRPCGFKYTTGLTFVQGRLAVMYTCDNQTVSMYLDEIEGIFKDMVDVNDLSNLMIKRNKDF